MEWHHIETEIERFLQSHKLKLLRTRFLPSLEFPFYKRLF